MKILKEVDEKYQKEIYLNILKAIVIILYFFILNSAYENVSSEHLEIIIKILTMLFLFVAIYFLEKAYKKDDGKIAMQALEILVLSAYTLTTKHITNKFGFNFKSYSLVASYIYAIYFILKSIVEYTKGRKKIIENYSDVREIVKKDEPIKKEASKKKTDKTEESNKKQVTKKASTAEKSNKNQVKKKEDNKTNTKKQKEEKKEKQKKEVKEND